MGFPTELLSKDEEIVLDLRPHWWAILPAVLVLVAAIVFGIILLVWDQWSWLRFVAGLAVLGALGYFGVSYAKWSSTNFVVTNERVISRTGVVAKAGIEIPLDRINTVFFNQGLFERFIGAGDLAIESAGEGGQQSFANVRKPHMVQQEIYTMMEGFEDRRIAKIGEAVGNNQVAAAPGPTIPEQIDQLDKLRQQGSITQAEFDEKKADLLRRM